MIKCGIEYSKYNNNKPACVIYNETKAVLTTDDVLSSIKIIPTTRVTVTGGMKIT